MPPKRKNDDTGEPSARERKKLKMAGARTISVQGTPTATPPTNQTNAVASSSTRPSKTTVQFDSMQGLPASLDVERFAEARAYEIDAMQKAIKAASGSSTHRAWQTLPRSLRRRAASHDVRRVPLRLQDKARAEMDSNKRRLLGRPKRGKANQITRTEKFLKRQRDKSWLETHVWHAKRAKMQNVWGYRLAVTPAEKAFRPSYRASMHGSILHDASYYATIELKGPQLLLQTVLEQCCDPQISGMTRCMTGSRACKTDMYKHGSYPLGLLGPTTILWQPLAHEDTSSESNELPAQRGKGKGKGKGKEKQMDEIASHGPNDDPRVVWVRCHPAIFEDVFESLRASASNALDQKKKKDPQAHAEIEIADLRGCINAFEIMGPKSSQVIKGALSPAGIHDRRDVKKFWDSLTDMQTPGSITRGMVIGLTVLDPRLKYNRFPPKNAKSHYPDVAQSFTLSSPTSVFPTALIAQSDLWDEEKRGSLKKPKYKKKDLDERRSKNLVPGTPLEPLRQDDRIPILLIQHSVESDSSSRSGNCRGIHGWTLLFPAGWAMAFLPSLLHTGTRFAGQREHMKQFFEAGACGFPNDYPLTAAYDVVTNDRAEEEKARWERTPPAKKPNYDKLGTRSPWRADWDVVLGLKKPTVAQTLGGGEEGEEQLVTTQRENPDAMQVDEESSGGQPWLLRGPRVSTILVDKFITPAQLLCEINKLRSKSHMAPLDGSLSAENLMRSALVMVRAKMIRRGAPTDMANIYKMDDPEARKWMKTFEKQGRDSGDSTEPNDYELGEIKPSQTDIIGYVTTGDASLSRGEGFAIGAVPVAQYVALRKQALRLSQPSALVTIRDRDGTTCRVAYLELLDS